MASLKKLLLITHGRTAGCDASHQLCHGSVRLVADAVCRPWKARKTVAGIVHDFRPGAVIPPTSTVHPSCACLSHMHVINPL